MNQFALVYPMAAMVLLTAVVLIRMVHGRFGAVKRGEVDSRFYKTHQGDTEPRSAAQNTRQFINLFESPVLFYAACIVAMVTHQTGPLIVWVAWAYVLFRIVHAFVHLGSNRIPPRMFIYGASWVALLVMWGIIVLGVASRS